MTTQHDYAGAIDWFNQTYGELTSRVLSGRDIKRYAALKAILHALRLAEALQNGPSEGMMDAGYKTGVQKDDVCFCGTPLETFKAMIEQLDKEIEG